MRIFYKLITGFMIVGALREKNDFVKTVLESLPHPFYVIDAKDYTIKLANSAACVKGFADGTTCYALTHKTDKPCGTEGRLCPLEEVKRTGKPAVAEHLHYDMDGNVRNMEVHCYPIFDSNGNVVKAIEYSLDITERKRAQEALAESEERYRTIIENSNDMIWTLDKDGIFRFINKQSENTTGYRASDIVGRSFLALLNKDDTHRITEIFRKTLGGMPQQYEITIKRSDGSDLTLSVNTAPFYSKGESAGTVSFGRDITQSRLAEVALRESEERFRSVSQSASDAIITSDSDGKIIFWNNGAQKMFGYQSHEVIGKPLTMLMPERYREAHIKGLERMLITGESHVIGKRVELDAMRKDGSEFPIELSLSTWKTGDKTFYSGILRDITEHRRNEKALVESEEKFRMLFDNATDGIMLADVETKKQNMANKKICTMLGYSLEEILNLSVTDIHPEKDIPWIIELFKKQARGEISLIENIPVKRKDGTVFYADINTSPVNIGGKLYNLGIFRDITERRRNDEMRRENERLALANRAKSEFLTVMSHELRTPLNAIIGFSDLLKRKDAGDMNEKQMRYTENVLTSGKQLLSIIDDILDITRVESGKMELAIEHMSVPVAVNEVLETIKEKARKQNIIVKIDLKPEIEFIDTDGQKFRQVLNNLLSNAVKFSKPEGGTITITAVKEGDMAKFSVSDTGIGIKDEDMGRLFHSFEQLDAGLARKYGGTGLRLAVSKKLVELLGGRITAESRYGEGSTFTFTLPIEAKSGKDT